MNHATKYFATLIAVLTLAAIGAPAKADGGTSSFEVSLQTSSLSGDQLIAFGLVNGGGGATNNVTLSGFTFGGGSAVPPGNYVGTTGVSGDLSSTIAMTDSITVNGGTALFYEDFDPGSALSFIFTTTNSAVGSTPDAFSMSICSTSFVCYSNDAETGAMLVLNLTGQTLSPASFTLNGASDQGLSAPVVTISNGSVPAPEPDALMLLLSGLTAAVLFSRRALRMRASSTNAI
jgi:hypothetical protein